VETKPAHIMFRVLLPVLLSISAGCERPASSPDVPSPADNNLPRLATYARYAPAQIDIMPLTELVAAGGTPDSQIRLYVSLLDAFRSQIKSPAVFRFEMYEYVQRSAEPKGKRAVIWADVDLTDPATNNEYWQDFLRAYQFDLPFEYAGSQSYILEVTCLCPNGRRLSSEFPLRQPP